MNTINNRTLDYWQSLASKTEFPTKAIVNGTKITSRSGSTFDCINPFTGTVLASVTAFDESDVHNAVASARDAFNNSGWPGMSSNDRKRILVKLAELIEANAETLALMDALSVGKLVEYAMASDVPGSVRFFQWYAELIDKIDDRLVQVDSQSQVTIVREPIGVVGLITPWNYPLEEAAMKLAPALAAGNAVVVKPPELSPFSCLKLGELALEAGIPPGVLNIVPGIGGVAGKALAKHPDVDCIGFTGSTRVGKLLMSYSSESNLKPVWLECGGKSPNIVFADCDNLEFVAMEAARSVFRNKGEVCSAGSRLLIERSIFDHFLVKLKELSGKYVPGNPLDPKTTMGPLASRVQYEKVLAYIDQGLKEGATLLIDGRQNNDPTQLFVGPTVFTNVSSEMTIVKEEIFGPVICAIPFDEEEDAIRIANDTIYGLVASVWTKDLLKANRIARRLNAGTITINGVDSQDVSVPFGGFKQSGIGKEHGFDAIELYTRSKVMWTHI